MLSKENEKRKMDPRDPRFRQHQQSVGPTRVGHMSLPPPNPHSQVASSSFEPAPKRQKFEVEPAVPVPPPPPPPKVTVAVAPLPPPPVPPPPGFEAAAVAAPGAPIEDGATPFAPPGGELLSEADFAASLPQPEVTLQIRIPNDRTQMVWNFYGQIIPLTINVMSNVKSIKEELSKTHLNAMPVNKIQLKSTITGAFLKDSMTLAALNIGPTATLEMLPRARGGRK